MSTPTATLINPAQLAASNEEITIQINSLTDVAAIYVIAEFSGGAEAIYFEDRFLPGYTGTWSPSTGRLVIRRVGGWPESFQISVDAADVEGDRIGVPVQVPASPSQVDGMVAWWRGDQYDAASGDLSDLSGLGNDLSQSTPADRPSTTTVLGQAAISFASGAHLEGSGFTGIREAHDLTAISLVTTGAGGNNGLLDLTEAASTNDGASILYSGDRFIFRVALDGNNDLASDATSNLIPSLGTYFLRSEQTEDERNLYIGTVLAGQNTNTRTNARINNVTMGKLTGISSFNFTGSVSEVLIFNRALSSSDMDTLYDYFNARYGLSL